MSFQKRHYEASKFLCSAPQRPKKIASQPTPLDIKCHVYHLPSLNSVVLSQYLVDILLQVLELLKHIKFVLGLKVNQHDHLPHLNEIWVVWVFFFSGGGGGGGV